MRSETDDFVIRFANINGTGSASTNRIVAKTLFRMAVPVGAKNIFPSNIKGMPTWYEIRANRLGYTARRGTVDLLVGMNRACLAGDVALVEAGGTVIWDSSGVDEPPAAPNLNFIGLPCSDIIQAAFPNSSAGEHLRNGLYLGFCAELLGLNCDIIAQLLHEQYGPRRVELNRQIFEVGREEFRKRGISPLKNFQSEYSAGRGVAVGRKQIFVDGNTACALGCLYAGASIAGWYPITPSTSLMDAFAGLCRKYRGKNFQMVQAEDEMAALGVVMGAMWSGARAFTATSGPGISLMTELLGYAYYAEIPVVLFDIQRSGPSTGMPTRTQQSDLVACAYASHGDTKHLLLFPGTVRECFDFARQSFDFAERFQTPVIVMSDIDLGMNDYVSEPLEIPEGSKFDRGKILDVDAAQKLSEPFYRYLDQDGDGVCLRSFSGTDVKASYFTRGSGHDEFGRYTEQPEAYGKNLMRIERKFETAAAALPAPGWEKNGAGTVLVYFGSTTQVVAELMARLAEAGITVDTLRLRAFPFPSELAGELAVYDRAIVLEQNQSGQMRRLLAAELATICPLHSVTYWQGQPLSVVHVFDQVAQFFQ